MSVSKPTLWGLAIAFFGGLVGADGLGAIFVALAAFIQACAVRRAPWRWAILSVSAWVAGGGVGMLLDVLAKSAVLPDPTQLGTGLTVIAAYAGALAGASLNWVASRMAQLG